MTALVLRDNVIVQKDNALCCLITPWYNRCNSLFKNNKDDITMQKQHVTNSHMTCKDSWEMTALFPWEYVNEEVSSLVVTLCR